MSLENSSQKKLNFRISSQLKSIIGKDLITDDYVAIFELVKNSFDAHATAVEIYFSYDQIYIIDNGKGLSYDDFVNKWLFVAYSAKKEGSEDLSNDPLENDYRSTLHANKQYAGSKGVGRFSCDRLGSKLVMQSRTTAAPQNVNTLTVDWTTFEQSLTDEFADIPVDFVINNDFAVPIWVSGPRNSGTVISITGCREDWSRTKILELKASLAKLINPFAASAEEFAIKIFAPHEQAKDDEITAARADNGTPNSLVNGRVENFIFRALQDKTTWLRTWIDKDSGRLFTELNDRGTMIYRVSEVLEFDNLADSNFECNLFYLNRAAKVTFARRMGVSSPEFGSIFLFKNGFRVYPIGEPNDDAFGIDRRKQQGHSRYLGTRDIVGRIDVAGDDKKFKESSSRDKGLIETPAANELKNCFWNKSFLRLENYVVGVSWRLKIDMDLDDASFLTGDLAKSKVIDVLNRLTNSPEILIEDYSRDIFTLVSSKVDDYAKVISNLTKLASKLGNSDLEQSAQDAAAKFKEMQKAEAEAIAYAERERAARREAELKEQQAAKSLEAEKQRNLFLTSLQSHDKDTLENLHHQVIIYASNAINTIEAGLLTLKNGSKITAQYFQETLENLLLLNQQVIAASRFATTANFRLESNSIEEDLSLYVTQYIERICSIYESRITVAVTQTAGEFVTRFKPIEISIILDNLIDNAYKAGATIIGFFINRIEINLLVISVEDDGLGVPDEIEEHDQIFTKGTTTTRGSGLGLYHVRQLLEGMKGSISLDKTSANGTTFSVKVYR